MDCGAIVSQLASSHVHLILISYSSTSVLPLPVVCDVQCTVYNDTEKKESAKKRNGPRMGVKWPRNICSQLGL